MDTRQPVCPQQEHIMEKHGDQRIDPFYWLKDRQNLAVRSYLEAENKYFRESMREFAAMEAQLYDEMISRIKPEEESARIKYKSHFYYTRFLPNMEYALQMRREIVSGNEEILLDENELAVGYPFFHLGSCELSPNEEWIAFSMDTLGRRLYQIKILNRITGNQTDLLIPNTNGEIIWTSDSSAFYYVIKDSSLRDYKVMRHKIGEDPSRDVCVLEEKENNFHLSIEKSKSEKYLLIGAHSTLTTEYHFISLDSPKSQPSLFAKRISGHEYYIDHDGQKWWIRTNDQAPNYRLMCCKKGFTEKKYWKEVIGNRNDVLLEEFCVFNSSIVLLERTDALKKIRILHPDGVIKELDFGEACYDVDLGPNPELASTCVRLIYSSLTTPTTHYDVDLMTMELSMVKRQEIVGGYDPNQYIAERHYALAEDGAKVPISLVYKRTNLARQERPLLLYGYGAYGISVDASFSLARLSLLDRGFSFAIAHIRGGQELGQSWYENGRLLKKMNTFKDFIACAEYLIKNNYVDRTRLFAMGGSAGGLLMGVIYNLRPELWRGVVAAVPFVDVLTTMLDDTIPLTTFEYEEWGNPHVKEHYDYMRAYSPYDNIKKQNYPALLITTGFHDSQVQYWEPAKWIAKLRWMNPENAGPFYLHCDMHAGHSGATGRYIAYKEKAMQYAFLISLAG